MGMDRAEMKADPRSAPGIVPSGHTQVIARVLHIEVQ